MCSAGSSCQQQSATQTNATMATVPFCVTRILRRYASSPPDAPAEQGGSANFASFTLSHTIRRRRSTAPEAKLTSTAKLPSRNTSGFTVSRSMPPVSARVSGR